MSLHLVIGQQDCLHYAMEDIVVAAIRGGITHVQLREKRASTREFLELGQRLLALLRTKRIPLIINDRVDIALALDADGVHLGQTDMPYAQARRILGSQKIIGITVENQQQMRQANQWHVQYVGAGPVFPTQTKLDAPEPLGLSGLMTICEISQHPVIAIGGINFANAKDIMQAGVSGIAVVSAICQTQQPEQESLFLKSLILNRNKQND